MTDYIRNHYVPIWYQKRFLSGRTKERKFHYLDLRPQTISRNGRAYSRKSLLNWGPDRCFYEDHLYTTKFGNWQSTEIEQKFFGKIDSQGQRAVEYFSNFKHPDVNTQAFHSLLPYMSVQKLRTPKGLESLSDVLGQRDKNRVLIALQRLQNMYCAIWTECVWAIVDASESSTKFLLSDHPITVYNSGCFPGSKYCRGSNDPEIWLSGTHTLFPLCLDKALILTNVSWVRNPYGNPTKERPNPALFRTAMFNFTGIQTGRKLSEAEVTQLNYVIKMRARRYIAAEERDWLYPERQMPMPRWDKFGESHLFMPDPRSVQFSSEIIIGYEGGRADAFDAFGRKPWQKGYKDSAQHDKEWDSFQAFKGEFARLFGPRRRGQSFEFDRLDREEDSPEQHASHLRAESHYRKPRR